MSRIAILGAGLMGSGMVEAALRRGDEVTVWNRTRARADALAPLGASVAETPAAAVEGAERVHIILSEDSAVDATLEAAAAALSHAVPVIDHTTTSPAGTAARAARLSAAGVPFLHAPVFMAPQNCREATGVMLVAGPQALFSQVEGALGAMTGQVRYLSERPDHAAVLKLFGNALIITLTAGLADVLAIATAQGLGPDDVAALLGAFNPANTLTYRGKRMMEGDYTASFELTMARKDVRLMLEAAQGQHLAALPAIAARMDQLIQRGLGDLDLGALAIEAVPAKTR